MPYINSCYFYLISSLTLLAERCEDIDALPSEGLLSLDFCLRLNLIGGNSTLSLSGEIWCSSMLLALGDRLCLGLAGRLRGMGVNSRCRICRMPSLPTRVDLPLNFSKKWVMIIIIPSFIHTLQILVIGFRLNSIIIGDKRVENFCDFTA